MKILSALSLFVNHPAFGRRGDLRRGKRMDTNFVVGAAVSAAKVFRSAREDTRRYTKRDPVVGPVNSRSPDRSAFRPSRLPMGSRYIVLVSSACPLDSGFTRLRSTSARQGSNRCYNAFFKRGRDRSVPIRRRPDSPRRMIAALRPLLYFGQVGRPGEPSLPASQFKFGSLASAGAAHQCVRGKARIERLARSFNAGDG